MIASSAFFVLDAILNWPVSNYDGSWSQWGQMAALHGGKLGADSPWRTDTASRSDNIVYNYTTDPGPVFYKAATTTQVNDMTADGTFTGTANRSFRVEIDGAAPDTFRWTTTSTASPITWNAIGVLITAATQTLGDGMTVKFDSDTGHIMGDKWDFVTQRPIEILSLDGSDCSTRLNLDGTLTYTEAGCTPQDPNSSESGNQIEEEDAAYFETGGGGGGGPVAPGYGS